MEEADARLQEEMTGRLGTLNTLELSERRFQGHLLISLTQFIGLLAPEGAVLEINRSTLTSLELRYNEVVGHPALELKSRARVEGHRQRIKQAVGEAAQEVGSSPRGPRTGPLRPAC